MTYLSLYCAFLSPETREPGPRGESHGGSWAQKCHVLLKGRLLRLGGYKPESSTVQQEARVTPENPTSDSFQGKQ